MGQKKANPSRRLRGICPISHGPIGPIIKYQHYFAIRFFQFLIEYSENNLCSTRKSITLVKKEGFVFNISYRKVFKCIKFLQIGES